MSLVLEKLDRRHSGNEFFKHRVWINAARIDRLRTFVEIRNWCWEVWGASAERDNFLDLTYTDKIHNQDWICHTDSDLDYRHLHNEHWAWHTDPNGHVYIYLTNDQALAFFKLKWM